MLVVRRSKVRYAGDERNKNNSGEAEGTDETSGYTITCWSDVVVAELNVLVDARRLWASSCNGDDGGVVGCCSRGPHSGISLQPTLSCAVLGRVQPIVLASKCQRNLTFSFYSHSNTALFRRTNQRKNQILHNETTSKLSAVNNILQPNMGNDGGSIPKRRELVKEAARAPTIAELKATALESLSHAWTRDPLSSEALDMENTASDWRGRLYNYESVLKGLVPSGDDDADDAEQANGHDMTFAQTGIKSLRDIVRLQFKRYKPAGSNEREVWACPVSLKELGPATKAIYIVPCGHVFAEVAIREIMDQEHNCPECSEAFEEQDIIPILPTEETDMQKLVKRMEDLRAKGLTHSKKQDKSAKKNKKRKAEDEKANGEKDGKKTDKSAQSKPAKANKAAINNPMTASLTAKVLAEQEERNKRRKLASASG